MRAFRWLVITVAVVVGLAVLAIAIGAAWLNTYIHSDAFKIEVASRAARSLGGTVQIDTIDFDIFHGIKLQGIVTQMGQQGLDAKVGEVNCSYAWTELLNRRLKLTGVTFDKPQIVLTLQGAKSPTEPTPTQSRPGAADSGAAEGEGTALPFQFVLDRAKIKEGAVSVRDASGGSLVELQGVNAEANTADYLERGNLNGKLSITTLTFPKGLLVTNFSTTFNYTGKALSAPFEAAAFNGHLAGTGMLNGEAGAYLELNAKSIDVAKLIAAANPGASVALSGSFDFQSKWNGATSGEGDAQLKDGKLTGVKVLQDLSGLLKIKELNEPIIKSARTHFQLANQQTQLTGLELESTGFNMTGDGTVGFDGTMGLNLVLILTKDSMDKLPREIAASFVLQPDGTGTIAFQVTGTTSNPQTDLPTRLLMQNTKVQNVIDKALNKLFH